MIILKSYKKLIIEKIMEKQEIDTKSYNEEIKKYRDKFLKDGWIDIPIEGGLLSPDGSTLFIYNRSPYEGQLLQYEYESNEEYNKICLKFLNNGEFIIMP